jgi:hypothetical protein
MDGFCGEDLREIRNEYNLAETDNLRGNVAG